MFTYSCFCIQAPSINPDAPQDEQQIARNVQALKNRLRGRGGRRRGPRRTDIMSAKETHAESECVYDS